MMSMAERLNERWNAVCCSRLFFEGETKGKPAGFLGSNWNLLACCLSFFCPVAFPPVCLSKTFTCCRSVGQVLGPRLPGGPSSELRFHGPVLVQTSLGGAQQVQQGAPPALVGRLLGWPRPTHTHGHVMALVPFSRLSLWVVFGCPCFVLATGVREV